MINHFYFRDCRITILDKVLHLLMIHMVNMNIVTKFPIMLQQMNKYQILLLDFSKINKIKFILKLKINFFLLLMLLVQSISMVFFVHLFITNIHVDIVIKPLHNLLI